jgi:hypothetical protein
MTIRGFRQGSVAHLAAVVTAALLAAGTPAAWAGPATSAKPATALEVQSEPAGASVYVDGQLKGATPVAVEGIASGDHTVRVVKEGFLENSRVVSVPASGRSLRVALTSTGVKPHAATALQVEPGEPKSAGGGGGSKKWLFIGLGAVVLTGAGVGIYLATKNDPPKISGVTGSPTTALAGATSVTFSASASDPNGDSLTYTWAFGDGSTGSGASASHVYLSAGSYSASVEVSDGKKKVTGTTNVTVKSIAGAWSGRLTVGGSPIGFTMNLAQNGTTISGNYADGFSNGPVAGLVSGPAHVRMTRTRSGWVPLVFTGDFDGSLDSINGTAVDTGTPFPFTMTRQ